MADLIKLHLGCGPHIFAGWHNLDLEPGPGGLVWDLRTGLPYPDESVDIIFTEHFIEHLTLEDGRKFLRECYRMLKPGGVIRISTPDLGVLINDYLQRYLGRYAGTWEPQTRCQMVNEGMRNWGHQFLYDGAELVLALYDSGFSLVESWPHHVSDHEELCGLEVRPYRFDLIKEARK